MRSLYDLNGLHSIAGNIGRLQTVGTIPVLPGDGLGFNFTGVIRLSPLKRGLVMDSRCDLCAFYVPHDQIYDNFEDFITEGIDGTETLETVTLPLETSYLGSRMTGVVPKWLTEGYNRIWNEYYRPPNGVDPISGVLTNPQDRLYGKTCARLPNVWSTGINNRTDASDRDVTVTSGTFSLLDVAQQQARLKTELDREFYMQRYRDIISASGGKISPDVDDRPRMLNQKTFWSSGYDVDGTDVTTLGQHSGRVSQPFSFPLPRWNVPRHGVIFIMALIRFPSVQKDERHFLVSNPSPSYAELAGDYDILEKMPPHEAKPSDFFLNGSPNSLGEIPYGNWYRFGNNFTHRDFIEVQGFPFEDQQPNSLSEALLINSDDYANVFATTALGHFHIIAMSNADVLRRIPDARKSVYAGAE